MEPDLETLRRTNAELQAWVRDLLEENRSLRRRLAEVEPDPSHRAPSPEPPRPAVW